MTQPSYLRGAKTSVGIDESVPRSMSVETRGSSGPSGYGEVRTFTDEGKDDGRGPVSFQHRLGPVTTLYRNTRVSPDATVRSGADGVGVDLKTTTVRVIPLVPPYSH